MGLIPFVKIKIREWSKAPEYYFLILKTKIMFSPFHSVKKPGYFYFIIAALCCSSCYSYRLATHDQPGIIYSESVTANAYLWGLANKPVQIQTPVCDSLEVNGVAEVTVKTNFGYALLTVATLGIWCPMKIVWICSKPCQQIGEL